MYNEDILKGRARKPFEKMTIAEAMEELKKMDADLTVLERRTAGLATGTVDTMLYRTPHEQERAVMQCMSDIKEIEEEHSRLEGYIAYTRATITVQHKGKTLSLMQVNSMLSRRKRIEGHIRGFNEIPAGAGARTFFDPNAIWRHKYRQEEFFNTLPSVVSEKERHTALLIPPYYVD